MNGLPFRPHGVDSSALTGGILGLRSHEIDEAMSAYFTLKRTTFRNRPSWCLEQDKGPDLLPFAVHHRKVRQAVAYAQQVSGLMRCVVVLEGRHRVIRAVRGLSCDNHPGERAARS